MLSKLFCLLFLALTFSANVIHYHYHMGSDYHENTKHYDERSLAYLDKSICFKSCYNFYGGDYNNCKQGCYL